MIQLLVPITNHSLIAASASSRQALDLPAPADSLIFDVSAIIGSHRADG